MVNATQSEHEHLMDAVNGLGAIAADFGSKLAALLTDFDDRVGKLEHAADIAKRKARRKKAAVKKRGK
jgi:hypothetical protein